MIVKGWCSGVCSVGLASFLTISGAIAFGESATLAQITPDSTLGSERSVVTPNTNVKGLPAELIEGGALRDANLFHSFLEFNVGDGQRVYFANPVGIENILTRVTGINPSNILGTLGVDGRANLFLLNPNGIIFGANAQLDIEGSFVASTANSLKFNDGSEFSATNPGTSSLLTISVPLGLQYGTNQAGTITNVGNLAVGKNLTLAANNLDLQGQLYAGENLTLSALDTVRVRDSQIAPFLAMAGGQLIVQGNQGIDILALNHSQSSFQSAGDLSLISDGNISGDTHFASGGKFSILNLSGEPGNFVSLYDPIISSEGDVVFGDYTGVSLKVEATGSISAGNIRITGPDTALISGSDPDISILKGGPALILRAGVTNLQNPVSLFPTQAEGTTFSSSTLPTIPGSIIVGDIDTLTKFKDVLNPVILSALGDISTGNIITTGPQKSGDIIISSAAGSINTSAGILNTQISEFSGIGAPIVLEAKGNITTGDIEVTNNLISLISYDGSIDTTLGTLFSGGFASSGGMITLEAKGDITVSNIHSYSRFSDSGTISLISYNGSIDTSAGTISTNVDGAYMGKASPIILQAKERITVGSILSFTQLHGRDGGDIRITADSVLIAPGAVIDTSTSSRLGNAGNIYIQANNSVVLSNSTISTATKSDLYNYQDVNAGNIHILARSLSLINGAVIDSTTSRNIGAGGNSGNIFVQASDFVLLADNSRITSAVESGAVGNGGDIAIQTGVLFLTNYAQISATTAGYGSAGDISVRNADLVFLSDNSAISTAVNQGATAQQPSNIDIQARVFFLTNGAQVNASTAGNGDAGNITVQDAELVLLDNGTQITASTTGYGNTGRIDIRSQEAISLANGSKISSAVESGAVGNSQAINLQTQTLFLTHGAQVNASTSGKGDAGDITVLGAQSVFLQIGAQMTASTAGQGDTGLIDIQAQDTISLRDGSQISSAVEQGAVGNSQSINLQTRSLSLTRGAKVNASTAGQGNAGDIAVREANSVFLDEYAQITASTTGQGNTGQIDLQAQETISLANGSQISSAVESGAVGNSQAITLQTRTLSVANNSQVSAATSGTGNAGSISVKNADSVSLSDNSTISTAVNQGAVAQQASNIDIQSRTLSLKDGAQIIASTAGQGNAGNIAVREANSVFLNNGAQITASTAGQGNTGQIDLQAQETISLANGSQISSAVESGAVGNSQAITLQTRTLSVANNSQVSAATSGTGNAGSISVKNADSVSLSDNSTISTAVNQGAVAQQASNIDIQSRTLSLTNGAQVNASTAGAGDAGNIVVREANSVSLNHSSQIRTSTAGVGNAGDIKVQAQQSVSVANGSSIASAAEIGAIGDGSNIDIQTQSLSLSNNAQISASTQGQEQADAGSINLKAERVTIESNSQVSAATSGGEGGNIAITANIFEALNGGQLRTTTAGSQDAGDITLVVFDKATLTGAGSGLLANTELNSTGTGGTINLRTTDLTLADSAQISAQSQGSGNAGNIIINASGVLKATNSDIVTATVQAAGGAIDITAKDVRLFGDSDITTSVFSGAGGGGNITLTADSVLAFGDSDILAFARDGRGGDITFNTPIFFGFAYSPAAKGTDPATLDRNHRVDINASGAVNGAIAVPNLDFIQNSLTDLPENLIDTDNLISNSCIARSREQGGSFLITGAGSLPVRPGDASVSSYPTGDVRTVPSESVSSHSSSVVSSSGTGHSWQIGDPIVEPTGVYQLPNGQLIMSRDCS